MEKQVKIQCKDIPDLPILEFLYQHHGIRWCNWFSRYFGEEVNDNSVRWAMPEDIPDKLILAKMKSLIKRGLSGGCPCGCRGDFEITDKGLEVLGKPRLRPYSGY